MELMSDEERLRLSKAVMLLLDGWGVEPTDIITLLGLPDKTRTRHLERFRHDQALPTDEKVMARVEHLVGIADALRTTYPRNANMGIMWLHKPHRRFTRRAPLRLMVEEGLDGLIAVRAELDCAYAWARSVQG